MATDLLERVDIGLIAILQLDAGLIALPGVGPTPRIVEFGEIPSTEKPCFGLFSFDATETGGIGDSRLVITQLTAVALEKATMNAMLERVELGVTQPLLAAQNLDACIRTRHRRRIPSDVVHGQTIYQGVVELTIWVTK